MGRGGTELQQQRGQPISAHVRVHWRSIHVIREAANICTCTLEEYNWGRGGGQYLHMYIGGV